MSLHAPPLTPCIGRCTTSTGDAVCRGCGRNLEQIRDWNTYTNDEKRAIMAQLPEKKR